MRLFVRSRAYKDRRKSISALALALLYKFNFSDREKIDEMTGIHLHEHASKV